MYKCQSFIIWRTQFALIEMTEKVAVSEARETYLSWDEYFMSTAFLSAMRSKDPVTQVGAVIVNQQKRIVGIGYNGMPRGCILF